MPRLVDVALPLPLDELFTYHVPPDLEETAETGTRAVVPFKRDVLTGVIVAVRPAGEAVDFATRPVLDVPDPEPVFDADMLRLTRWVADYYLTSWGETLRAALPQGISRKGRWIVRPCDSDPQVVASLLADRAPAQARVLRMIAEHGDVTLGQLRRACGTRGFSAALRALERDGRVVVAEEIPRQDVAGRTERTVRLAVPGLDPEGYLGAEQRRLVQALKAADRPVSLGLVRQAWGISPDTVHRLEARGIVVVDEHEVTREPDLGPPELDVLHPLTPHQRVALDRIRGLLDVGTYAAVLCHGVTGSGKTRVYLDAIQHVVEAGDGAIVLVPEISLTPQTVRRFKARFGDQVAVLHSQLSVGERYDAWRELRAGRRRVAVGPRSAVFAPVQRLRLIVVDEEHDGSYKQDEPDPRYHARDVAVVRAQQANAVAVLGSATPSLESLDNACRGKYAKVELPERVDGRPMPVVRVVDMRTEREGRNFSSISRALRAGIHDRLQREQQVVLLQNRRGYSPIVQCLACGSPIECRDCQVTMTYHQADELLRCHYCGNAQRPPKLCPSCGAEDLRYGGAGTQKVQEEILVAWPNTPLIRMDQDTTRQRNAHHRLLEQFRTRQASILLGTQMVAKGLDFPGVTLVGVISADIGLGLPDFRASERTFQLLTQVAGRTGRGDQPGEVIIQTYQPDHPAVVAASTHDVAAFAERELAERRMLGYPPYGRLVLCLLRGMDEAATGDAAERIGELARKLAPSTVEVLGPAPAPIARIRKHWRWHVILKGTQSAALRSLARTLRERYANLPAARRVSLVINVDPVAML